MNLINSELQTVKKLILENLDDPISDKSLYNFISSGSKYIRSTIAILYLKSQNINLSNDIYNILAAGEIIHNASLLHDDVIDNAKERRGTTTISNKFSDKISILAGDYLLSLAIEILLRLNNSETLNIFKDCTKFMSKAEIEQYFLRGTIPTAEKYLEICQNKTAKLFSAILESSAILTGISKQKAYEFGNIYGICFQIKNDLEDFSAQNDKQNKIYTAKDIFGIEKTKSLLDNYKKDLLILISEIPHNEYKKSLEDIINSL